MMPTQKQIRAAFWNAHPTADRKRYPERDWTREDHTRRDNCQTDTECEAEEAARCWILCQR